jgi:hypothetical protein
VRAEASHARRHESGRAGAADLSVSGREVAQPHLLEFNDAWGVLEEQVLHTGMEPEPLLEALQTEYQAKLDEAMK